MKIIKKIFISNRDGFTIMELMTVVAIIGILSAITIPNLIAWRTNYQLNSMVREIQSVIQGARLQATKGNSSVTISFNTAARKIQTEQINRAGAGFPSKIKTTALRPDLTMTTNFALNKIVYDNRGMLAGNIGGTITITNAKGKQLKVIVASTGKPRIG